MRHTIAALSVPVILLATIAAAAEDDAIESRRHDLEEIEARVQTLEQDLSARRGSRTVLLSEVERFERDISDLSRAGRQLEGMINTQQQVLGDLQTRLTAERDALASERAAVSALLRSAYTLGRGDRIRLMLDQEDSVKLSRIMSYYGYLNRYRVARIDAVVERARNLEALTREAASETARLSALAAQQDETRRRLSAAQAQRTQLLDDLEQTIVSGEERVAALRVEAEGLRLLLEQLERQAAALPEAELRHDSMGNQRGRLNWPVATAQLTGRFGSSKGDGGQLWDGVLIAAPEGTEVRAVHYGRIVYSDWLRGFGLLMIIEHDDGYMTLYGHNQTLLKEPGEWVSPGDVIALSGSTGGLQDGGLYFAIRHRGKPVDPQQWCRAPGGSEGAHAARCRMPLDEQERRRESPIQYPNRGTSAASGESACRIDLRSFS
jgi:septal ring factor EnvC (AmiA/AmiB activator)